MTRTAGDVPDETAIDPTTGLPIPGTTGIDKVSLRAGLDLRRVSVKDVLDALAEVVDCPIRCAVQDYGVIISRASNPAPGLQASRAARMGKPEPTTEPRLVSRAFQLDKRHFLPRLKATFGITGDGAEESTVASGAAGAAAPKSSAEYNPSASDVKAAVVKLAEHLGVNFRNPAKKVFYNHETGMLMLRASAEDLETMAAAMQTLSDGANPKNVSF